MKQDYALGDECWIFAGDVDEDGPQLTRGLVIHKFKVPWNPLIQHVIQLEDRDFNHMKIRDVFAMAGAEGEFPAVAKLREPTPGPEPVGLQ